MTKVSTFQIQVSDNHAQNILRQTTSVRRLYKAPPKINVFVMRKECGSYNPNT